MLTSSGAHHAPCIAKETSKREVGTAKTTANEARGLHQEPTIPDERRVGNAQNQGKYSPQRTPMTPPRPQGLAPRGSLARPHGNSTIGKTPPRLQVLEQGLGGYYRGCQYGAPQQTSLTKRSKNDPRVRLDNPPLQTQVHQHSGSTHNAYSYRSQTRIRKYGQANGQGLDGKQPSITEIGIK